MISSDPWMLLGNVIFGAIGAGAVLYGWKQRSWRALVLGVSLTGLSFVISNIFVFYGAGIFLCAALYFWQE